MKPICFCYVAIIHLQITECSRIWERFSSNLVFRRKLANSGSCLIHVGIQKWETHLTQLESSCLLLKKCKFINNFRAKFKYCQNKSQFIFIISLHDQQSSFSIFSTFRLSFFFTLDFLPAKAFIKSALSNCTRSRWFGISVTDLIVLSRSGSLSLQGT